ncbi:MAG: hypothetical protein ACXVP1_00055 [Thermoleophilia bacterium]
MGWVWVVIVSIGLLVALAILYWLARRLKRGLDAPTTAALAAQEPLTFTLTDTAAASLAHLSQEPILIKQAEDGLRVQLDNRPLVPIAILTDLAAAAALREIVAGASQSYGARWTALVIPAGDGSVSVQRLA